MQNNFFDWITDWLPREIAQSVQISFAEFMRLDVASGAASEHTITAYFSQLKAFLTWCQLDSINPITATTLQIKEYRKYLEDQKFAVATISHKLAVVRRFYDALQTYGIRADHPAKSIHPKPNATPAYERIKYHTLDVVRQMLKVAEQSNYRERDQAMILLMAIQGFRACEIARLKLADISFEQQTLRVLGKRRKVRTVYMVPMTNHALAAWLQKRISDSEFVFINVDRAGKTGNFGMTTRGIRYVIDAYLEQVGAKAPGISCHSLRHTYATNALANGASLYAISKALGHSDIRTTQIYADILNAKKENPALVLEQALGN